MRLRIPDSLHGSAVHIIAAAPETCLNYAAFLKTAALNEFPEPLGDLIWTFENAGLSERPGIEVQLTQDDAVLLYWAIEWTNAFIDGTKPEGMYEDATTNA